MYIYIYEWGSTYSAAASGTKWKRAFYVLIEFWCSRLAIHADSSITFAIKSMSDCYARIHFNKT